MTASLESDSLAGESDSLAGRKNFQIRYSGLFARLCRKRQLHWAYWLAAFSLAAVTCLFVWSLLENGESESVGEFHSYAIAAALISPGQEIMPAIQFVERPSSYMPEGAISNTDAKTEAAYLALKNSVARDFIYPGEAILPDRLSESILLSGAVVAIPVPADSRLQLSMGDRVDLLAASPDAASFAVAKSAQVFSIQERSIGIIIKIEEVEAVVSAVAAGGVTLVQIF